MNQTHILSNLANTPVTEKYCRQQLSKPHSPHLSFLCGNRGWERAEVSDTKVLSASSYTTQPYLMRHVENLVFQRATAETKRHMRLISPSALSEECTWREVMREEGSVKSSGNSSYMQREHQNNLPTQCLTQINLGELKSGVRMEKRRSWRKNKQACLLLRSYFHISRALS